MMPQIPVPERDEPTAPDPVIDDPVAYIAGLLDGIEERLDRLEKKINAIYSRLGKIR